ncbi:hypothetical protein [Sphingobium sp. HWE2-09]|uniref:hypothetical protein n=1 Tax=Sphingobium sp. HWE2-09 TaxID=3108390 RepID=UPI002DC3F012|nr:hypothetical protein [Sphingobium sp. HWE2-09]
MRTFLSSNVGVVGGDRSIRCRSTISGEPPFDCANADEVITLVKGAATIALTMMRLAAMKW